MADEKAVADFVRLQNQARDLELKLARLEAEKEAAIAEQEKALAALSELGFSTNLSEASSQLDALRKELGEMVAKLEEALR